MGRRVYVGPARLNIKHGVTRQEFGVTWRWVLARGGNRCYWRGEIGTRVVKVFPPEGYTRVWYIGNKRNTKFLKISGRNAGGRAFSIAVDFAKRGIF